MADWNDRDRDTLRTLCAMGASPRQIAEALGASSRDEVNAEIARLGLSGLSRADARRGMAIERVARLMGRFDLAEPLHLEALVVMTLIIGAPRSPDALPRACGVTLRDMRLLLARIDRVWPEGADVPARWEHEDGGDVALLLDLAFLAGRFDRPVVRGPVDAELPRAA